MRMRTQRHDRYVKNWGDWALGRTVQLEGINFVIACVHRLFKEVDTVGIQGKSSGLFFARSIHTVFSAFLFVLGNGGWPDFERESGQGDEQT